MSKNDHKNGTMDGVVSIRNGPVRDDPMDVDGPSINGSSKRKQRASISKKVSYREEESESDAPLVRLFPDEDTF